MVCRIHSCFPGRNVSHLAVGQRRRCAVLGERGNLVVGVAEGLEHFVGVAAEGRARAICRLIAGDGERNADSDEFTHLAALIDADKCVACLLYTSPSPRDRG